MEQSSPTLPTPPPNSPVETPIETSIQNVLEKSTTTYLDKLDEKTAPTSPSPHRNLEKSDEFGPHSPPLITARKSTPPPPLTIPTEPNETTFQPLTAVSTFAPSPIPDSVSPPTYPSTPNSPPCYDIDMADGDDFFPDTDLDDDDDCENDNDNDNTNTNNGEPADFPFYTIPPPPIYWREDVLGLAGAGNGTQLFPASFPVHQAKTIPTPTGNYIVCDVIQPMQKIHPGAAICPQHAFMGDQDLQAERARYWRLAMDKLAMAPLHL